MGGGGLSKGMDGHKSTEHQSTNAVSSPGKRKAITVSLKTPVKNHSPKGGGGEVGKEGSRMARTIAPRDAVLQYAQVARAAPALLAP